MPHRRLSTFLLQRDHISPIELNEIKYREIKCKFVDAFAVSAKRCTANRVQWENSSGFRGATTAGKCLIGRSIESIERC